MDVERTPLLTSRNSYDSRTSQRSVRVKLQSIYTRTRYYVPSLDWIPQYSSSDFFHDAMAGLTLACLLIPQSIGYATQLAGIPSINGLFSAAIPALVYPFFCTGRHVSVGPEPPLSLLVGQLINQLIHHHSSSSHAELSELERRELARSVSTLITFQTGIITFAFGLFRLGFLDAVLSKPLLRGFVTANAVVIAIEQLTSMLGLTTLLGRQKPSPPQGSTDKLFWLMHHLRFTHPLTAVISIISLIALLSIKLFKSSKLCHRRVSFFKFIPEILLVVILATILSKIFNWAEEGVEVVGPIRANEIGFGLPWKNLNRAMVKETFGTSLTICICGFVDSIVAAKSEGARFHYAVSPNRELVALGVSNLFNSVVAGNIPAFGSITRSRLNASTGARTPLASIITGLTILSATYVLLDYLSYLPKAVLATVITTMVFHFFAQLPPDLTFFWKLKAWSELGLMTFTFLMTLIFDVKTGIILSVGASLVLTVKDATAIRVRILGRNRHSRNWEPIDWRSDTLNQPVERDEEEIPGVLIVKIRESLSFANVGGLKERLRRLEMFGYQRRHPSQAREREQVQMIVFDLGDVEHIDPSALQIFRDLLLEYRTRDVEVWLCHIKPNQLDLLRLAGIVDVIGDERVLPNVNEVLKQVQKSRVGSEVNLLMRTESDDFLPRI
ncbi:uncharacterized protein MELLADRAFT_117560 [Melampsora larici-populina 98AG31]|uniref:STAS domain-containing protein n=1 Tax=Melampsora larici-populina (strain 98AG31 / pathotype 3-4-7) TaxID=747676 RepID=F4RYU9_MELLP|nr:uncharacterized protein MELLADRAFT_117560 [Melampsora larici-populina 98AG31]EGG02441.1 hypothetical protein MELLADRAFT_117560 [Melampsora larici-populina 98AG31]